ncbi:cell division protein FtsZ [Thermoplasmatales archaeon ex4484_30]|nr:MAG: cell division protein FtsZ [Thermoplasmatales archaeon ex4484_30]
MKSLISDALEYGKEDVRQMECDDFGEAKIVIVGCGGAGGNTINRLHRIGIKGADTIAINTDKQDLDLIDAEKKLLIGKNITRGLGAGGYPDVAKRCAEESKEEISKLLGEPDLVFLTAGMGGGTGTGASPVIARIAKRKGAIVVAMVSTPFRVERGRLLRAEQGLEALRKECDSVVILDNNKLIEFVPNLPIDKAFSVMDQLISETVKGISDTILQPSLINLDYADVKTIVSGGDVAAMLWGEGNTNDGPEAVALSAMHHPLLEVDFRGAKGCLLHITGGPDMTLEFANKIAECITAELDPYANVIWGARVNKDFHGKCRVMAIMTGVNSPYILTPTYGKVELAKWEGGKNKLGIDLVG